MTREFFTPLCEKLKLSVGENIFKSEAYIECYLNYPGHIYHANCATIGGRISRETKLDVCLRILAGGDPLDIALVFDVSSNYCKIIIYEVIEEWIIPSKIGDINMNAHFEDEEAMSRVSKGFAIRSNGVLTVVVGAING